MSNFVFLSAVPNLVIENLKLTVKFTASDLTKSNWIFRIILKTPDEKNIGKGSIPLYLLIKQTIKENITVDKIIDTEQHRMLKTKEYLEYLGRAFTMGEDPHILKIDKEYDIESLRNKSVIIAENI